LRSAPAHRWLRRRQAGPDGLENDGTAAGQAKRFPDQVPGNNEPAAPAKARAVKASATEAGATAASARKRTTGADRRREHEDYR
jgi:hypothetical protein